MRTILLPLLASLAALTGCAGTGPTDIYAAGDEPQALLEIPAYRNYAAGGYYPALLRDIDGRVIPLPGNAMWGDEDNYEPRPSDRRIMELKAGEHELTADINRALIVANAPRGVRDSRVPDYYDQKRVTVTLEPGKHYVLSAVVPEGDFQGWYPVVLEVDDGNILGVVAKGQP